MMDSLDIIDSNGDVVITGPVEFNDSLDDLDNDPTIISIARSGVPKGGSVGQVLTKLSSVDYESDWEPTVASVFGRQGAVAAASGDYTASLITNTPSGNVAATDVQAAITELDTEKVAKAGDTMAGELTVGINGEGLYLGTNALQSAYINFQTRGYIGLGASAANLIIQGGASKGILFAVNNSTFETGVVAGFDSSGNLGLKATSNVPTHTLTLGSTATGIALYNTADQTTNYERVRQYWSGNVFNIAGEIGGTGTARNIRILAGAASILTITGSSASFYNETQPSGGGLTSTGFLYGSSGVTNGLRVLQTVQQSGTAGYTALLVNPTESTTGSGLKYLTEWQVGGSQKGFVNSVGAAYFLDSIQTPKVQNPSSGNNSQLLLNSTGTQISRNVADTNAALSIVQLHASSTGDILQLKNSAATVVSIKNNGVFIPVQAPTSSAPAYVLGGVYFDTTLNKLRVGGATAWETITSV